jgi:hypothetical protein
MAVTTMNLIAKQTVGAGGAATVTFSNIPQTFTDLKLVISARTSYAGIYDDFRLAVNGQTAATWRTLYTANGTSAGSINTSTYGYGVQADGANATASTFSNAEAYIPNYTSTGIKSLSIDSVSENNATVAALFLSATSITNGAAINSISFTSDNSVTIAEFSTFYLYGISSSSTQNTTTPLASGGDVITTDGSYWYHAFKYSGSFTPLKNLTADILVVAGGGGGGGLLAGGGGAGGLRGLTAQSLTATAYTVTVGAGGAGSPAGSDWGGTGVTAGSPGASSSIVGSGFTTFNTTGGGGGSQGSTGGSGGSGGGGSGSGGPPPAGGAGNAGGYTPVEGYAGGAGNSGNSPYIMGGGGGGATAVGKTPNISNSKGDGGAGSSAYSSWGLITGTGQNVSGTIYYAGGGGGGDFGTTVSPGGLGGGGNSSSAYGVKGLAGMTNTGGGGGGGTYNGVSNGGSGGGNGGSGIIIVRYAV